LGAGAGAAFATGAGAGNGSEVTLVGIPWLGIEPDSTAAGSIRAIRRTCFLCAA
jgi:hypothetical protein